MMMIALATMAMQVSAATDEPPVWPFEFSATLAKIQPERINQTIQWTKLYYDFAHNRSRFDFFINYPSAYTGETTTYYIIYFQNTTIWYHYPLDNECIVRATDIPSVSPWWLSSFKFKRDIQFRALPAQLWVHPMSSLAYVNRIDRLQTPMRSTNQLGDPGATDWYDFVVGEQPSSLWNIPKLCLDALPLEQASSSSSADERVAWAIFDSSLWPGFKEAPQY
jgi:hypothetical protein